MRRSRAARRAVPRRLHPGRLFALLIIAVTASTSVALMTPRLLPAEAHQVMTDPGFDAVAFYEAHPVAGAARNAATAQLPGAPTQPKPVAGLTQTQTNNAYIIVEVGRQLRLPKRAMMVAIATSLQETRLRNLANPTVPASMRLPHDGVGSNYDSVGLFQQRVSMGWGTVTQLMDPAQSSARFYARLVKVRGWTTLSIGSAAQAVQRSAFPDEYAKHTTLSQRIVDALPSY